MLIVTPPSVRNEMIWSDAFPQEHLLERISLLELRLMQVTDRLGQALDLMLRQSRTVQSEHLLVETLLEALTASGVIEGGKLSQLWQDKKKAEERQVSAEMRRASVQERILSGAKSTRLDLFTRFIKEGFQLLGSDDEKQAMRMLERAAALEPHNFALLSFVGEHFFRHDKPALARDYLSRAHQVSPHETRTTLLLAFMLADDGELQAAKELLEPFGDDKGFAANFIVGMVYAAENRLSETLAAFKRALAVAPNAETHYLVGSAYCELDRTKMALRHLQKAVELDVNFADAWFMLGSVQIRLGNEQEAKEALTKALAARDASAQSHSILRNPKKYAEIGSTTLLFARLRQVKKNLLSTLPPRLIKLLRENIEAILSK